MKRANGWKSLERLVDAERKPAGLSLVPVLGSGFVTQAARSGARMYTPHPSRPAPKPVDWLSLLSGVAKEFECAHAAASIQKDVPGQTTLLWDAMVTELTSRHAKARTATASAAHTWEARMRRSVADRLKKDRDTVELSRSFVESFLRLGFSDVLSFNFDSVLLPPKVRPTHRLGGGARRASLAAPVGATTVWYPHGHLHEPDSIVLGAHAYGVRIAAMQAAFDLHAREPAPRKTHELGSFVATTLERPLLFVGLSLTREEWTIWWLLSQRARYLARRPAGHRPPAFVFLRRPPPDDRLEADASYKSLVRACELLGLTRLEFGEFDAGWTRLRKALGWPV